VVVSSGVTQAKLSPGQQVQVAGNGEFKLVRNADTEEAVAWKNGFFQFNHCDLQAVMRQLSRWYNVEVVYQGNIPVHQFGGKMGRDLNLSEVLEGLEKSLVHFKIENKKLIVMP
jgi:ferric-dicitrate binding protein FerR (iron transport regulator)